jgi:hypothetical protein
MPQSLGRMSDSQIDHQEGTCSEQGVCDLQKKDLVPATAFSDMVHWDACSFPDHMHKSKLYP